MAINPGSIASARNSTSGPGKSVLCLRRTGHNKILRSPRKLVFVTVIFAQGMLLKHGGFVRRGSVLFCSRFQRLLERQVDAYLNTDFSTDPRDHT